MQQRSATRQYSIRDFAEWHSKGELELAPKFQRRSVWPPKARSYLIDTIIRGKPIPKIYMRQKVNPKTRRTRREVVDGQQRLRTVLDFVADGFPILGTHNKAYGRKRFSQLDEDTQKDILEYEFTVDLLQDMHDADVYDVFARMNTFSVVLNAQELRNARWFGEFKTAVYNLSQEFITFWGKNRIFTEHRIVRMAEAEFVSELLIAMSQGIRARSKPFIDNFYKDHDDHFPRCRTLEKRFRATMDAIGGIMGGSLQESSFSEARLFYPLFCAIYHLQYELPELECQRVSFKPSDYPTLRSTLEQIDDIIEKVRSEAEWQRRLDAGETTEDLLEEERQRRIEAGESAEQVNADIKAEAEERETGRFDPLTSEERRFYDAYSVHWVHADRRRLRTEYVCGLMVNALGE